MASQHVNAVAIVSFRCLLRAPEAKLALLTPLILAGIFGGMVVIGQTQSTARPGNEWVTPFVGIGIIGATLFGLAQLMINIFGMDRGGFRAFVLMPVRRRDVLVGKNLSLAPLAGGMSVALVLVLQLVSGMRPAHLLATLIQLIPSYLVFCLIGNTASILAPSPVASGSLKPVQPNLSLVFTQLICTMFAPIALVPAMVALGMELALASTANIRWLPVYLVFSLAEAVLVIGIYRRVVTAQGEWLERRESRMLEVLTQAPE